MNTNTTQNPDEDFNSQEIAEKLISDFLTKLNKKELIEFCEDNDLKFSSDELASSEIKDTREIVFGFIKDQIGLFETAKSLSEEIIQNFFSTKNTAEIIKFCTKYKLPEYYQKSLQGVDPQLYLLKITSNYYFR